MYEEGGRASPPLPHACARRRAPTPTHIPTHLNSTGDKRQGLGVRGGRLLRRLRVMSPSLRPHMLLLTSHRALDILLDSLDRISQKTHGAGCTMALESWGEVRVWVIAAHSP